MVTKKEPKRSKSTTKLKKSPTESTSSQAAGDVQAEFDQLLQALKVT